MVFFGLNWKCVGEKKNKYLYKEYFSGLSEFNNEDLNSQILDIYLKLAKNR